ncbi:MAG: histidine--tRNA ligase [Bacteroidales bacterium]|nr:histidine--tRNA ligase [Bacteroidales bacterium]
MAQKPSIPKGTRDFSPEEMVKRNYIFDTIKSVFKKFGFQAIETPAMENLSTLMGKYGEEGDKLLFKILNSGDFLSKTEDADIQNKNSIKVTNQISEKGLRYDLTVPFARFVVQHRNDITFPFKRYQIQPVWRADKPQKGRYREFYQCDVDVVGSNSLLNEFELLQIVDEVFNKLDINVLVKLNNRKILSGIAEIIGQKDKIVDITVAIDKLDKIGLEKVNEELYQKGIPKEAVDKIQPIILLSGTNAEKLDKLKQVLKDSEVGMHGIKELEQVFAYLVASPVATEIELDLTLARGLNYYTGAIIEVKAKDAAIGSICGGGRYDDLTGIFGMPDVSGVGISFGADRIYDVLQQLQKFPAQNPDSTKVLFTNFGQNEELSCLPVVLQLREKGINVEIYPEAAKMKKQMAYADKREIPYVVIIGTNEMTGNRAIVKNMKSGEQEEVKVSQLTDYLA